MFVCDGLQIPNELTRGPERLQFIATQTTYLLGPDDFVLVLQQLRLPSDWDKNLTATWGVMPHIIRPALFGLSSLRGKFTCVQA